MPTLTTQEIVLTQRPDRLIMRVKGIKTHEARAMANYAITVARRNSPKVTGDSSKRLKPIFGPGYFGVRWQDKYVWFQENGIRPFTMTALAGKTIPMWIDDPTGAERQKNPKAKTRVTASGKTQVLIFRRAARIGQTKTKRVKNPKTGVVSYKDTPMHYPGAPGRIAKRQARLETVQTPNGPRNNIVSTGRIAPGNVGVWWRHPGITPRYFINNAMTIACQKYGYLPQPIYVANSGWKAGQ